MTLYAGHLDLADIVTQLNSAATALSVTGVKIGSCDDTDYTKLFGKVFPAIWVAGENINASDNGLGMTDTSRQDLNDNLLIIPMAQKVVPSVTPPVRVGLRMRALEAVIMQGLFGWKAPETRFPFSIKSWGNGPNNEVFASRSIVFQTKLLFQRR